MRLKEIIFQGIFQATTPVRLDCAGGIDSVELPAGITPVAVQNILLSVLYPTDTPQAILLEYANGEPKISVSFEHRGKGFRILRRSELASLRLQSEHSGQYTEVAAGGAVEDYVSRTFGLPDFDTFWSINLWRFDESSSEASRFDLEALDPKLRDIVDKYRVARQLEDAEDALKGIESRIVECRRALGQGAALEDKLAMARKKLETIDVSVLSSDDFELLRHKDERLREFDEQIGRLQYEEDLEREKVYQTLPQRWFKIPVFWAGLAIALVAIAVGVFHQDSAMRIVALVDIIGFGMCAWVLINYFGGMERASLHQVRLESIRRRLNQVKNEEVTLQERLNHLLVHAKVNNPDELEERVNSSEKLRGFIQRMEEQVAELSRDDEYVRAKTELIGLEERLAQAVKDELPNSMMSAYQLENDLENVGLNPQVVLSNDESFEEDVRTELERLIDAAQNQGQWDGRSLFSKTRKMWGKIAGHVLGDRFKTVDLSEDGEVEVTSLGAEQMEMWRRTRPSEYRALLSALAMAIQVNAEERSRRGFFESILIEDPNTSLSGEQASKFREVFSSAAKRSPVAMLRSTSW